MVGNLRAAGLTGPAREGWIVVRRLDARDLTPEIVRRELPAASPAERGVFCFNPPYGRRVTVAGGERGLLELYRDLGRALARFPGWRAAVFVANPAFVDALGHRPASSRPASNGGLSGAIHVFDL
jgi:23S rRNA G2445 N2-methylase RlmL